MTLERLRSPRIRNILFRVWRMLPTLVLLAAIAAVPWVRRTKGDFWSNAVWDLALLASFVGWGRFIGERLCLGRKLGWGMHAALGMALSLAVGGALLFARLASRRVIVGWVVLGIVAGAIDRVRAPVAPVRWRRALASLRRKSRLWNYGAAIAGLGALMLARYLGSLANIDFNPWDDNLAYRGFARQMLDSGTLFEPFSYHRVGSYCGQSYLHAMALALGSQGRLHVVDDGLCMLVLGGLVIGHEAKGHVMRAAIVLALVLLATLPYPPHNIQSELSGTVFFFAMYRLLDGASAEARPRSKAIALGLLAAAMCTLRQNYAIACAAFVAFNYASVVVAEKSVRRRWIAEAGLVVLAVIVFLAPWAAMSYRSAGTFLYPVMKGTTNPNFGMLGKISKAEELTWMIQNFLYCWPVRTLPFFMVAGVVIAYRARTRALHGMLFGAFVGFFTVVHLLQSLDQLDSLARYYFPFTFAFALAVTLKAGEEPTPRRGISVAFAVVAACVVFQVVDVRSHVLEVYGIALANMQGERNDKQRANDPDWILADDFYRRMQFSVPAGERLLIMVDETFRFDGARNQVLNYDQPGALSPRPGVPYFKGEEAFADYMASIGIRYVAFTVSESSREYSVSYWKKHQAEPEKANGRGGLLHSMAKYELDAFETLMAMTKSRKTLFHEGDYWVLDMATRVSQ